LVLKTVKIICLLFTVFLTGNLKKTADKDGHQKDTLMPRNHLLACFKGTTKKTLVFNKLNFHTVQAILGSSAPLSKEKKKLLYKYYYTSNILLNITRFASSLHLLETHCTLNFKGARESVPRKQFSQPT
jgi:hypothetical protein